MRLRHQFHQLSPKPITPYATIRNTTLTQAFIAGLTLLAIFCFPANLLAQQAATATLSGRVTDPAGAIVAKATVAAKLKSTGAQRKTESNGEGIYVLSNLVPGEYEITIEASGLKRL